MNFFTPLLRHRIALPAGVLLLLTASLIGCAPKNPSLATPQGQALLKTQQIVQKSGGDWNKLSSDDQQTLINGPGGGSEAGAKSFLATAAARASYHPGAPPAVTPGRPPGH